MSQRIQVTVEAPINIAFVKYWGKREGGEELILPANDSFSVTLSTRPFRTKTSVELREGRAEDEVWLNGKRCDVSATPRIQSVLSHVRESCPSELKALKVLVVSENNFPTAAGMASSASGYCALAAALVRAYRAPLDVSALARLGSGSACRSVYGGFVMWLKGQDASGADCVAAQFADESHWPEMQVLCAVFQGGQKSVPSTSGMQQSFRTSPLMAERIRTVVPRRMREVAQAIKDRDFETFAAIAIAESDDLQEILRTTTPRIQYATEDSYAIIRLIKAFNAKKRETVAAYTFDAGANCFVFTLKKNVLEVVALLMAHFPTPVEKFFFHDDDLKLACVNAVLPCECKNLITFPQKSLEMLLQSPVGSGVKYLGREESLIVH